MKKYIIVCQCDVPVGWSLESKSDSVTFGIALAVVTCYAGGSAI
ncbi:hypothetical protein [Escherichia coli]|nr:hypothetical protein [Escherichia coli]